jgi:antitoxin component of MazEF toxin-antitoxin module
MSTTLLLDPSGGLFIPPTVIEGAHWSKQSQVEVELTPDGLLVRPGRGEPSLEQNEQGDWVIRHTPPVTNEEVIRAIAADRK